jgi:shikimate kinase
VKTIVIGGLPGCGKSTVGRLLAERLSCFFIDTDILIEKQYENLTGEKLSCRQIFSKKGSLFFREMEKEVLVALAEKANENHVISLGGGTIETPENIKLLQSIGKMIYLKGDPKVFFKRIICNGLPAYLDMDDPLGSFEKLALKRNPIYESVADMTIETDYRTPEQIVAKIIENKPRNGDWAGSNRRF